MFHCKPMIQNILVLGSGSAGLIAALSFRRKIPEVQVRVVRSPDIGVIGVGEGTTPNFPAHIFDYLGIQRSMFYQLAEPTWKLGIRFEWGPRGTFNFSFMPQLDAQWNDLPLPHGFFCDDSFANCCLASAMMDAGRVFPRQPGGAPDVQPWHAFHIENEKFVAMLERLATQAGVEIVDGRVTGCERGGEGVRAIHLDDGRRLEADFFVDCSGFRSELLGRALEEPFESFGGTLFCDRAVVGGWDRGDEPILPYTTASQMDAGWCWRIEHEHRVNRGYVYCSDMISDEEAAAEFRRKAPKVGDNPRIVKFRSGCHRRSWVGNVVAIGNSSGFVEPLEATALMIVCSHVRTLVDFLRHNRLQPTPSMRDLFNSVTRETWLDIRDFLGLHYKLNTALHTPFWRRCREETDLSNIGALLDFYAENGPTGFCRYHQKSTANDFGLEGYLVMLIGQRFPYRARHEASAAERQRWESHCAAYAAQAKAGITVEEALRYVRHPGWQWHGDRAPAAVAAG